MKEVKKNNNKLLWNFNFVNYLLFFIGICFIIAGYILMYTGEVYSFQAINLSSSILLIGYCIFIPLAILYKKN